MHAAAPLPPDPAPADAQTPDRAARWWPRALAWLARRERLWWWLHSLWALLFGIIVMWLGERHYAWLRFSFAYVGFIWATSLVVPAASEAGWVPARWQRPVQLAVNYFNRNLYQQLLFFILPVYWQSTTPGSRNTWFIIVLAVSAVLSTFDVVYDRHLAARRPLAATFLAFNAFACVNVTLPIVWGLSNAQAVRWSAALAAVGFITVLFGLDLTRYRRHVGPLLGGLLLLAGLVEFGRPWIPPAPLRLGDAVFATTLARRTPPEPGQPLRDIAGGYSGRLYVITPVLAPLGLRDRVRHAWFMDDTPLGTSSAYEVVGGRARGYRLWTSRALTIPAGTRWVRVDVETDTGQLVGRARLRVVHAPASQPSPGRR